MKYAVSGRTIDVPQEFIDRTCRSLGCGPQEACEIYASDEGIVENVVVSELTEKANDGKQKKTRKVRPDYTKRALVTYLAEACARIQDLAIDDPEQEDAYIPFTTDVAIDNPQRIISFSIGDDRYELTLSRKRKPKN